MNAEMKNRMKSVAVILLLSAILVEGQRPSFAGSRPIGYPELANRTTTEAGLSDKFGEDTTTQRLPIEANGDRDLVDRLSKLPIDQQPFWFINWQALEAHRKKPQTYPQRPSQFIEPSLPPVNTSRGTIPSPTGNTITNIKTVTLPSNTDTPIADKVSGNTEDRFSIMSDLPEATKIPVLTETSTVLPNEKKDLVLNDDKIDPGKIPDLPEKPTTKKPDLAVQETNSKPSKIDAKDDVVQVQDKIILDKIPDIATATKKPILTVPDAYFKSSTILPDSKPDVLNEDKITLDQTSHPPAISVTMKPALSYVETYFKSVHDTENVGQFKKVPNTLNIRADSTKKPALTYLETYFKAKDKPSNFQKRF